MKWRKPELLEPELGPELSPEHRKRLMEEHRREIETAADLIYQAHKLRLAIGPLSWPDQ